MSDDDRPAGLVGIGASAGGLDPLGDVLDALPANIGVAVVVVVHLSPNSPSMMAELMERRTAMVVSEPADGDLLLPNHVYVLGPGKTVRVDDAKLIIEDRPSVDDQATTPHPIDQLFESMASWGKRAATIVLSGTGNDGTSGSVAIRDAGGLAMAQDATATFPDMPMAAIHAGGIEATGPPADLAGHLEAFFTRRQRPATAHVLTPTETSIILELKSAMGVDFGDYKTGTVGRRIGSRAKALNLRSNQELLDRLRSDGDEVRDLSQHILIGVTSFFRNYDGYEELAVTALPELLRTAAADGNALRLWSIGCATGQEAYSLAITALETRERLGLAVPIKIFATDVHEGSLATARTGWYLASELHDVDEERRNRYFEPKANGWQIRPEVRGLIAFSRHNILDGPPFSRIDLLACRNTLIYFSGEAQRSAMWAIDFAIRSGGILFVGESDYLGPAGVDFEPFGSTGFLHRKIGSQAVVEFRRSRRGAAFEAGHLLPSTPELSRPRSTMARTDSDERALHNALYAANGIGVLMLNEFNHIVQVFGDAVNWLAYRAGPLPSDGLQLIQDVALRTSAQAVLRQLGDGQPNPSQTALIDKDGELTLVRVGAFHLQYRDTNHTVLHGQAEAVLPPVDGAAVREPATADAEQARIELHRLRAENESLRLQLDTARNQLADSVHSQQTSRQALAEATEELIVVNGELQTNIEELSSTNEELRTVADQNEFRLGQIHQLSGDLETVLETSDYGVILLNPDRTIRRFSAACHRFYHLVEADVGRPFAHLRARFDDREVAANLDAVMDDSADRQISIPPNEWSDQAVLVRLAPHQLADSEPGLAVTLVDVTEAYRQQKAARISAEPPEESLVRRNIDLTVDRAAQAERTAADDPLTNLADTVQMGLWQVTLAEAGGCGKLIWTSADIQSSVGLDPASIPELAGHRALHPDDRPVVEAWTNRFAQHSGTPLAKPLAAQFRLRNSDNTWTTITIRAVPVRRGGR